MSKKLLSFVVCVVLAMSLKSQEGHIVQNQYKFKFLTVDQGLSNNNVSYICQDARGFMWFATRNGADRFDGQNIVPYRHNPKDSTTISNNIIRVIFSDSKSNLWVGTAGGLDLYNPARNNFIRFRHEELVEQVTDVNYIAEDQKARLWIASGNGLYVLDLNTNEMQVFRYDPDIPEGLPANTILRVMVDKNNDIWISCLNEGICIYNQYDGIFTCYKNDPDDPQSISGNRIERFYEDNAGNIWIGTFNNGLNLFNSVDNTFTTIIPDINNNYTTRVRAIFEDPKGNFFVGTRGGLYMMKSDNHSFISYAYEGHNFSEISQNSILCSYIDKTGSLWLGTYSGGVNYTNLLKKEFIHYKPGKDDPHFLSAANIYAITEDESGNLWIGSENGLNYLNRDSHTFTYFYNDPDDPNSLSYNDIKALEWDEKGNLWIGTNRGGLNYLDMETNVFHSYRHDPADPSSLAWDKVYGLMCDSDNDLWILTNQDIDNQYSSIDILPSGSDKFIHLNELAFFGIIQGMSGDVFIGGIGGFWKISKKDSVFNFISNDTLIGLVNTMLEDSEGVLWAGSEKGLTGFNPVTQEFVNYSSDKGYPISTVFGLSEDNDKNIWASTTFGLIKIMNIIENPDNIEFRIYGKDDGLQSKQFNYNAFYKSESGEMAFGGINGFNTFFPDKIGANPIAPDVVITDLKIFNKSVSIGEKVNGRIIITRAISETKKIVLGRKQNVFSLEFAALHYVNPEENIFKYKLDGFNKDWHICRASNNYVSYTNLPPDRYVFMVSAANPDQVWNENSTTLIILVLPPFWKTLWFRISLVLFILSATIGFYFYRVNKLKRQQIYLQKLVIERTREIEEKNEILIEQSNELNEINTILEERQQQIEEQTKELEAGKQELEEANVHLNETNTLLEERSQQIEEQAEILKAQKEELEEANLHLNELNSTKDKFFSIIAHDLKNPFNTILGFSELLTTKFDKLSEEKKVKYSEIIYDSSKNIYSLLENLLQWARTQTDKIEFAPTNFKLKDLADQNITLLKEHLVNKKITLKQNIADASDVYADRNMIYTVLRNLLTNAIKFTNAGGDITLGSAEKNGYIEVSVKDTGTGMSEEETSKLFRVDNNFSKNGTDGETGTGLGLILCKEFVVKNGGKIWVESIAGKGSTFSFTLRTS